jgi:hypothetical protein
VDGLAHNLRPWFTKFNGKVIDHRWTKPVEDIYGWHYKNERYLRNERSQARVALVYSQQTASFYGGDRAPRWRSMRWASTRRWSRRGPLSTVVHDHLLDAAHIGQHRTLILPNLAALSPEQCGH